MSRLYPIENPHDVQFAFGRGVRVVGQQEYRYLHTTVLSGGF
jgi:hypothetical protein